MKPNKIISMTAIVVAVIFIFWYFAPRFYLENSHLVQEKTNELTDNHSSKSVLLNNNENRISRKSEHITKTHANKKMDEKVVDQTLHHHTEQVLSEEKIEVEFTLIDGEQNKILANYQGTLKYKYDTHIDSNPYQTILFKSDEKGKFKVSFFKRGYVGCHILTNDFVVENIILSLQDDKNILKAVLHKGCTLEVRAIDEENTIVGNLSANFQNKIFNNYKDPVLFQFDSEKRMFFLNNAPVGYQSISFSSTNFLKTESYQIILVPNVTKYIEITFTVSKVITFEIDSIKKPDYIDVDAEGTFSPKSSRQKIYKNKLGKYEYSMGLTFPKSLIVYSKNHIPLEVFLSPDTLEYKINLKEGAVANLEVKDSEGVPLNSVEIIYMFKGLTQYATTNENGIAILTGLDSTIEISLNAQSSGFNTYCEKWLFNVKNNNSKIIVLTPSINNSNHISGRILYEGKPVAGAIVSLIGGEIIEKMQSRKDIISSSEGSYDFKDSSIGNIEFDKIGAFHYKYGVTKFQNLNQNDYLSGLDLELTKEKSVLLTIVDVNNVPIPKMKISINYCYGTDIAHSSITNDIGECEFFNLIHGRHYVYLDDKNLTIYENEIKIPSSSIILTAKLKKPMRLKIMKPDNTPYFGLIRTSVEKYIGIGDYFSIQEIFVDGYYDFFDNQVGANFLMSIEAIGYPVQKIIFEKKFPLPEDLVVQLQEGKTIKITVLNDIDNSPISNAMVNCFDKVTNQKMATNADGVVEFPYMIGKINIEIKKNNFAHSVILFDCSQAKEVVIKLKKGGALKGNITIDDRSNSATITLKPGDISLTTDRYGNFEFHNLFPQEYAIMAQQHLEGFGERYANSKVAIENEKTTEINLDEFIKK